MPRRTVHPSGLTPALTLLSVALGLLVPPAIAQEEFVVTIETTLADTTETFWLQIPAGYDPQVSCPLLIGWHQWGSSHMEFRNVTQFDSVANARGWIAASHNGPSTMHWNNQAAQSHVVDVIAWISDRYAVDADRIYMVGGSMGGAAGMVFSNNHLDPDGPIIAAAASVSGIQDCERRFYEQGINNSMIAAFGGTPIEVPFEYHRNSAVYFADSTESMHVNARHLPLLLVFGNGTSDLIWREHAEDLYAVLNGWADHVVLHESALSGHGWSCAEEGYICDFLASWQAVRYPLEVSLNADEPGRAYWTAVTPRADLAFARLEAAADLAAAHLTVTMVHNVERAECDLSAIDFPFDRGCFTIGWSVEDLGVAELVLAGVPQEPATVMIDGSPYTAWYYDPQAQTLTLLGAHRALYAVIFDPAAVPEWPSILDESASGAPAFADPPLRLRPNLDATVTYQLAAGGELRWQVLDPEGRLVRQAFLGECACGEGSFDLPRDLPVGVYLVRLTLGGSAPATAAARVTLIR